MEGKVLIVDDDQRLCRMLQEYLETNGLGVGILNSGDRGFWANHLPYINFEP